MRSPRRPKSEIPSTVDPKHAAVQRKLALAWAYANEWDPPTDGSFLHEQVYEWLDELETATDTTLTEFAKAVDLSNCDALARIFAVDPSAARRMVVATAVREAPSLRWKDIGEACGIAATTAKTVASLAGVSKAGGNGRSRAVRVRNDKIRESYDQGTSVAELSEHYDLSPVTIRQILAPVRKAEKRKAERRAPKHVPSWSPKIQSRDDEIRKAYASGTSRRDLAKQYGVSVNRVSMITRGVKVKLPEPKPKPKPKPEPRRLWINETRVDEVDAEAAMYDRRDKDNRPAYVRDRELLERARKVRETVAEIVAREGASALLAAIEDLGLVSSQ